MLCVGLLTGLLQNSWPKTFDWYLYAFDGSLGVAPGSLVTHWWKAKPVVAALSTATYGLFLVFLGIFRVHRYQCCPAAVR